MKKDPFLIELGARIKAIRLMRRMMQADLARETGLNVDSIGDFERGKHSINISNLKKIADVLKVKIKDFF